MMGGLLNLGNKPLASLLQRSMARLVRLGLISVDLNCTKDVYMLQLVL